MEGRIVSHYRIVAPLGGGGMGVVYRAEDLRLKRPVALKFLPHDFTRDDDARERFVLEAQAASALDHPNICTVYEIDTTADDQMFIAMAYYDGETLKQRIRRTGPLPVAEALDLAIQIGRGLAHAHVAGIIHRDIKPPNLVVSKDGFAKILDFGIARLVGQTGLTRTGVIPGTVAYMAPEQIRGGAVDARTDIWALGQTLREMLTGQPPGEGETSLIPAPLQAVVARALEEHPNARYQTASEFAAALGHCLDDMRAPSGVPATVQPVRVSIGRRSAIAGAAVLIALAGAGAWAWSRSAEEREVRSETLPAISRLVEKDAYAAAFALATGAERVLGSDPVLAELWPQISRPFTIATTPAGASVSIAAAGSDPNWTVLGTTPLTDVRVPRGGLYLRVEKPGFEPVYSLIGNLARQLNVMLDAAGAIPPRMVRIPGGELAIGLPGFEGYRRVNAPTYLIDRYEVTNQEYKAFVDAGGYRRREYWREPFVRDGRSISWEDAMTAFRDRTGRPGPSTWDGGTYPEGEGEHPVAGVSWYEAAAYAAFAGKSLPTVYHWLGATAPTLPMFIIPQSNFGRDGLVRTGSFLAGAYGTHDMAGNVKEWCWNETTEGRYVLGGGFNEPTYLFNQTDARSPFDRSSNIGFRTVDYLDANLQRLQAAFEPITPTTVNYAHEAPVSDEVYRAYAEQFEYDGTPLNVRLEPVDDSSRHWRKETISFDAAYLGERLSAYLFLPKGVAPPYQTVVYFPPSAALRETSSENLPLEQIDFLIKSGRAVLWPIYKDTYERRTGFDTAGTDLTRAYVDHVVWWVKDVRRSVDYLTTRTDIAANTLTFFGFSWGAHLGPVVLAVEPRFRAGVLLAGGFRMGPGRPEVHEINFAPRVKVPVLMLNGRHDSMFPLEAAQKPMFRWIGTSPEHKKHVLYESGHAPMAYLRAPVVRDILRWLDEILGAVD